MKKQDFLKKIMAEGKLGLTEPSRDIKQSYLKKSENCLKSAKILLENGLYENSTSEAYYCMYNSLLALLYQTGIKSENHSASIIILEKLFDIENCLKPQHLCCGSCKATSSFLSPKIPDKSHTLVCGKTQGFFDKELAEIIRQAKAERIDKQYYVETQSNIQVNEQSCREMLLNAENAATKIKLIMSELNNEIIFKARKSFENLF